MKEVFQIVYLSHATEELLKKPMEHIDDIIDEAKASNEERNITGLLLYRNGLFMQLLEGTKEDVLYTLGKVATDKRHGNILTILKQFGEARLFDTWSMTLRKLNDQDVVDIENILSWKTIQEASEMQIQIPNKNIMELLRHFAYKK